MSRFTESITAFHEVLDRFETMDDETLIRLSAELEGEIAERQCAELLRRKAASPSADPLPKEQP